MIIIIITIIKAQGARVTGHRISPGQFWLSHAALARRPNLFGDPEGTVATERGLVQHLPGGLSGAGGARTAGTSTA